MKSSVLKHFGVSLATVIILLITIPALSQEGDTTGNAESEDVEMVGSPHHIGYRNRGFGFGGPNTPQQQLDDDDVIREPIYRFPWADEFFKPWFETKKRFNEENDFQYSFDYNLLSLLGNNAYRTRPLPR